MLHYIHIITDIWADVICYVSYVNPNYVNPDWLNSHDELCQHKFEFGQLTKIILILILSKLHHSLYELCQASLTLYMATHKTEFKYVWLRKCIFNPIIACYMVPIQLLISALVRESVHQNE